MSEPHQHDGKRHDKHIERGRHTRYAPSFLFIFIYTNYLLYIISPPPHPMASPTIRHTPHPSINHPSFSSDTNHEEYVLRDVFFVSGGSLTTPLHQTSKTRPHGRVFDVQLLLHPTPH